ncbi:MAG TPA: TIR domain-containing protein [Steroidobacteraceae bacterium]|nr:TIR domain-containing protein [Steroidobacteraceae bacterium]
MSTEEIGASHSTGVSQPSTASGAVFLSHASQDVEAAQRICAALRGAGIEVWFDQSELRGGDAWDRSIRKQIKTCALFIPVISHATHDRREGYFRLEWKLAVDRSYLMDAEMTFLLPVVIDDTRDDDERVPERFREVHWTRLPGGETPLAFVDRVRRLLTPESSAAPDPAGTAGSAAASGARGLTRSRRQVRYGAITLVAAALALGYLAFERLTGSKALVRGAASIAVLPLANESGEASQQYFSDGISEDLITALGQFPGLKVIGRSSAFQFRDSKEDSRSIGAKLGVAHLLEGSVRKSGDTIRVSAELIDTADGSMQWSERYDRPYKDLFALQDEITRAVAGALRTKLLPGEHAAEQSKRPPGGSLEAYNALLQGQFFFSRNTEADYRRAIEYYAQATQLDPRYALAWSDLSQAWINLGSRFLEGTPAQESYAKARAAADRALVLSPDLAAAHLARGELLRVADFDWRGAESEYRRALTLAPSDGEATFYLGRQLATLGAVEPAIELTHQALATEPLQANWYSWLASYLSGLNRLSEAERAIRRAIELGPGAAAYHYRLTMIEVQRSDAPAALDAAQQEPPGPWQDIALASARQIGGDRKAADAALRTLIDRYASLGPFQIAEIYALRNDAKATFEWLDRALSNHDPGIVYLLYDPFILRYKDDARFAAFCRKVGLPVPGEMAPET